jgi:diacylglycerol kinase family enzyme
MPQVKIDKTKEITIQSDEGFATHADGELIGLKLNEVKIHILPKAMNFVVPKENN